MTMEQLSAYTVKIQLSQEELPLLLPQGTYSSDSEPVLHMISFLLTRAEAFTGIPFTQQQVTAELLSASDGGLILYLTAMDHSPPMPKKAAGYKPHKTKRIAAAFVDRIPLQQCCTVLQHSLPQIPASRLYQLQQQWILLLQIHTQNESCCKHILQEYGRLYPHSPLQLAQLDEYGICLHPHNAVARILKGHN